MKRLAAVAVLALLAGCAGEDPEAKYLRALQVYSLEQQVLKEQRDWLSAEPDSREAKQSVEQQRDRVEYAREQLQKLESLHPRKPH